MSIQARKIAEEIVFALVVANNDRILDSIASFFHADVTATSDFTDYRAPTKTHHLIASPTAIDTPTAVALVNETKSKINFHFADSIAHDSAVSAAIATPDATDEATAIVLANANKAAWNVHLSAVGVHYNNDGTNTVAASDATNAASLYTLANEQKGDYNAHIISAPAGTYIDIVEA